MLKTAFCHLQHPSKPTDHGWGCLHGEASSWGIVVADDGNIDKRRALATHNITTSSRGLVPYLVFCDTEA